MFETSEVRWFCKSKTWPDVEAWFAKGPIVARVEPFRIDHYLSMPLEEELGIKVRDGRLEIKRCALDDGVHRFNDHVSGHMATWRKWAFPVGNSDEFLDSTQEPWIRIGKDRSVRKFRVSAPNRIDEVDASSIVTQGCVFEFTRLNLMKDSWCSIGIEAFGDDTKANSSTAESVVRKLLDDPRGPILPAEMSMDYPEWLSFLHMSSSKS